MSYNWFMWEVRLTKRANEKKNKLPIKVQGLLLTLLQEIKYDGPYRHNWKNFGKLEDNKYHCHIKKGNPTYVVCWEIIDKIIQITEVYYVGTHEKAPY